MILHWLTQVFHWMRQYPPSSLFCIIGGCFGFVGNGIRMLSTLDKQAAAEVLAYAVGTAMSAGLAASYVLRVVPQYKPLADVLGDVAAVLAISYPFLLLNSKKKKRNIKDIRAEPTAPSNEIWPPPPISQDGTTP